MDGARVNVVMSRGEGHPVWVQMARGGFRGVSGDGFSVARSGRRALLRLYDVCGDLAVPCEAGPFQGAEVHSWACKRCRYSFRPAWSCRVIKSNARLLAIFRPQHGPRSRRLASPRSVSPSRNPYRCRGRFGRHDASRNPGSQGGLEPFQCTHRLGLELDPFRHAGTPARRRGGRAVSPPRPRADTAVRLLERPLGACPPPAP
ncbi:hypothetical protein EV691_102192 [Azotobacter chroococcum]|uniref:Uncharacterized protein n=1 Tax=Azotobacter chroococcum TaxID=353 RepID=A0A4R1PVE3_9GAMM|nr:hypothetical protein EV691_102192 [Azotobacter chroococcum]